ncbi:MAG: GAF domain-containing protein [Chloroflexi bacterium]|nr:MAG: GAF domain-containing protein [Chloroflexota bacterium]
MRIQLTQWWQNLTLPGKDVPHIDKFKARFLASISFIMIVMIIINELVVFFLHHQPEGNVFYSASIITCIVLFIFNRVSRGPYYPLITWVFVAYLNLLTLSLLFFSRDPFTIRYFTLSILIAGFLIPIPYILALISIDVLLLFTMNIFNWTNFSFNTMVNEVTYLLFMFGIIIIMNYYRNLWEIDNQHILQESRKQLEKKFKQRTLEKNTLNQITVAVSQSLDLSDLFQTLARQLEQELHVAGGVIFLYDEMADSLSFQTHWGIPNTTNDTVDQRSIEDFFHKAAIRNKTAVFSKNLQQIAPIIAHDPVKNPNEWQGLLSIPFIADGKIQGVVGLFKRTSEPYTQEQVNFFQGLGIQVGVAIQNSRLYADAKHARHIAEVVQSANLALTQSLDMENILVTLLDYLHQLVPFDSANVMLFDKQGSLALSALRGYINHASKQQLEILVSQLPEFENLHQIITSGKSTLIEDTHNSPNWKILKGFEYIRCWLGVPLLAGGQVIGLYNLEKKKPFSITNEQVRLAESLTAQAAVALQNSFLYEEVHVGQQKLKHLAQQVVAAQEDERSRVSRELHDEAGQALTALKIGLSMELSNLSNNANQPDAIPSLQASLKSAIKTCDITMNHIRLLAHDLRPAALDDLGLNLALEGFCEDFADRTQLNIVYQGDESATASDAISISLYRLLQEALTNVARHSQATHVCVQLLCDKTAVSLTVTDNGIGFPIPSNTMLNTSITGVGLAGMQERLQLLGGTLTITSLPEQETTIHAIVPLQPLLPQNKGGQLV